MINKDRLVKEFVELVQIDSLTKQERQMADALTQKLEGMGLKVYEDDAGQKTGGNAGNLICVLEGDKTADPILLMAHMDTVVPGTGKKPVIEGNIIKSDGSTVLGGDDIAGVECILEAIRVVKENSLPHGDITTVFTIAEEGGLYGARNADYSRIHAKYGFVFDSGGPIGAVDVSAPSQNNINIVVKGKAAHAGVNPEDGISAIQIASEAISQMKLGKLDQETTANIGIINGGLATNIICDRVEIKAEARSRDEQKLEDATKAMEQSFKRAAEKFGGSFEFCARKEYSAFNIKEDEDIIAVMKKAAENMGIELKLDATGGGSDTNVLNSRGIKAVNVSVGMDKVHTVEEQINMDDMVKAAEFIVQIIKAVAI